MALSVEELTPIIVARARAERFARTELNRALIDKMGGGDGMENENERQWILGVLEEKLGELIADRLKSGQSSEEWRLEESHDYLISVLFEDERVEQVIGVDPASRAAFDAWLRESIDHLLITMGTTVSSFIDPRLLHLKAIRAAMRFAAQQRIRPEETFDHARGRDEVTRQLFTKEQYAESMQTWLNEDYLRNLLQETVIEPMVALLLSGFGEDSRANVEQIVEEEVMPELHEKLDDLTAIMQSFCDEELERIYNM